jgi:hypothetical protein
LANRSGTQWLRHGRCADLFVWIYGRADRVSNEWGNALIRCRSATLRTLPIVSRNSFMYAIFLL